MWLKENCVQNSRLRVNECGLAYVARISDRIQQAPSAARSFTCVGKDPAQPNIPVVFKAFLFFFWPFLSTRLTRLVLCSGFHVFRDLSSSRACEAAHAYEISSPWHQPNFYSQARKDGYSFLIHKSSSIMQNAIKQLIAHIKLHSNASMIL